MHEHWNDEDVSKDSDDLLHPRVLQLKTKLLALATRTDRGFHASNTDRNTVKTIVDELARFNPSMSPARGYYGSSAATNEYHDGSDSNSRSVISGKWNLIYTDAPDITGLDTNRNPLATVKLGRIGQECQPPYIKNVIEWLRPDWARNVPFSGTDLSRVLQKVVTLASSSPSRPSLVNLKVAGLEVEAMDGGRTMSTESQSSNGLYIQDVVKRIQEQGLPVGILSLQPVDWKFSWNPPLGQFEILYVDADLRVIRTGQNYLAANQRILTGEDEWF
jgi:hypothetical protein